MQKIKINRRKLKNQPRWSIIHTAGVPERQDRKREDGFLEESLQAASHTSGVIVCLGGSSENRGVYQYSSVLQRGGHRRFQKHPEEREVAVVKFWSKKSSGLFISGTRNQKTRQRCLRSSQGKLQPTTLYSAKLLVKCKHGIFKISDRHRFRKFITQAGFLKDK